MAVDFIPNDFINIGDFDIVGDEFTLMAWINPDSFPEDPRIIAKATGTASAGNFWALLVDGPTVLEVRVNVGAGAGVFNSHQGITVPPTGVWQHVAGVYDGSTLRVYLDGVQDGGTSAVLGTIRTGSQDVWLGANPNTASDRPWDGDIDDARIYDRALTAEEILTIFTARGTDGIVDGLLSRYQLNEQPPGTVVPVTADFVKDAGPSKNDGDAVGGPIYSDSILRFRRKGL
ncbi:hypothetical protein LCGC14_1829030 [marine sediment metagenome]|uniref:LamG-like jellyroll fold domain-containing protein n=1 Tax=marine sediment metagenome TaxID=412755 RepID=A0A0F9GGV9_9ZZZZ